MPKFRKKQLLSQDDLQRLEERVRIEMQAVEEGLKVPHASGITGIQECPKCGAMTFEVDMSKVVPLESQED